MGTQTGPLRRAAAAQGVGVVSVWHDEALPVLAVPLGGAAHRVGDALRSGRVRVRLWRGLRVRVRRARCVRARVSGARRQLQVEDAGAVP